MKTKIDLFDSIDKASKLPIDKTPLFKVNKNLYLKREDLQITHSFKIRGAYNAISNIPKNKLRHGVLSASAGNHAQGVALASQKLGIKAQLIMPVTTPAIKINAVKQYGAKVDLVGNNYSEASLYAKALATSSRQIYIHPFDNEYVIAGQGVIAKEILEELPDCQYIFVPVGGGGLLAGILGYAKHINRNIKIVGVEPEDSACLDLALKHKKPMTLKHVGIFADGVAVKRIGTKTFKIIKDLIDINLTVSNDQICAAIAQIYNLTRTVVEGSGALALAGYNKLLNEHSLHLEEMKTVCIISGANLAFEKLQFIAERTLMGSGEELLLSITLPEIEGALNKLLKNCLRGVNITQLSYRKNDFNQARILIGLLCKKDKRAILFEKLDRYSYKYTDLSHNEVVKEHLRHSLGNYTQRVSLEVKESFFNFDFPEKVGALESFLNSFTKNINISLFHYRGLGGDNASVLIGLEYDGKDTARLHQTLVNISKKGFLFKELDEEAIALLS